MFARLPLLRLQQANVTLNLKFLDAFLESFMLLCAVIEYLVESLNLICSLPEVFQQSLQVFLGSFVLL